jgi:hypothetical protein
MARFDAFTGPFNTSISPNITSEQTMNWIPERNAVPINGMGTDVTDKNVRCALIRTPGLATFSDLPKSPIRGLFPGENRLFAAAGDHFYEVVAGGSYVDRSVPGFAALPGHPLSGASGIGPAGGPIGNDGWPVQCFLNGNQALIISAGMAYCDNGNGPVPLQFTDPLTDLLVDPSYLDGKTLTTPTSTTTNPFFDATDVGRTILITGGAGFNVGLSQVITAVHPDGGAIGAAAWGTPGSGLGTGIENTVLSFTDLQLPAPYPGTVIQSPTRPFGPSEIGATIVITGGTGFTPGTYTISGLQYDVFGHPTGNAIISPNAGTAGAVFGIGTIQENPVTASQGAFLDGYGFVVPNPKTKTVYYSAINDFTSWNPLDFFVKEAYPDNVAALFADHQELYTMGDLQSTQVMRDVGNADNPFAPDPGAIMHLGCQAPWSVVRLGNGVAWIGEDVTRGGRRAYHAVGYNPVPVSTPAVEAVWAGFNTVRDAVAFTMSDRGHEFWVISFQTAGQTWVYDTTTGWWHQRGYWVGGAGNWDRIRPWVHCLVSLDGVQDLHYGGDWGSGRIYVIGENYKTDDGNVMWRSRWAPHLTLENMRRFYARFELDCDRLGQQRIFWNRLGAGRDRIWRVDTSQAAENGSVQVFLAWSDDRTQTWQYAEQVFTLDPSVDVTIVNAYLNDVNATWH